MKFWSWQKIVKARKPGRMPSNGLEITKRNETSHPESLVVGFLSSRYFLKLLKTGISQNVKFLLER
jgi:hypothetical protein